MNIIAAIDFSDMTPVVLAETERFARAFSARVYLIHVAEPEPAFVGFEAGPPVVRDQMADTYQHEHRRIQEKAEGFRQSGLEATALLIQGPTVRTLLDEAKRLDAGLIVAGSHGHGAVYSILVGSVSEGLIRHASCPVLVVPAKKADDE